MTNEHHHRHQPAPAPTPTPTTKTTTTTTTTTTATTATAKGSLLQFRRINAEDLVWGKHCSLLKRQPMCHLYFSCAEPSRSWSRVSDNKIRNHKLASGWVPVIPRGLLLKRTFQRPCLYPWLKKNPAAHVLSHVSATGAPSTILQGSRCVCVCVWVYTCFIPIHI